MPLSQEDNSAIWKKIYETNPQIQEALEAARREELIRRKQARELSEDSPEVLSAIDRLLSSLSENFESVLSKENLVEIDGKYPLYQFWNEAGLYQSTGKTASEFFKDFVTEHNLGLKFESYDYEKGILENSKVARNNEIVRLLQARLSDPETAPYRYTPGNFDQSSLAAKQMRMLVGGHVDDLYVNGKFDVNTWIARSKENPKEKYKPKYDVLDVSTLLAYNHQNQIAGTLIGIFANHNINHVFASLAQKMQLATPIELAGHKFSDLLHSPEGRNSSATMAEFLAASVDAVKDPVLNFLNLNATTADVGALLARLGFNPREIGLLFNQPIIKELCSLIDNDPYINTISDAVANLKAKYKSMALTGTLSEEQMAKCIIEEKGKTDPKAKEEWIQANLSSQGAALYIFEKAALAARDLSSFVGITKFTAANSVKSSYGSLMVALDKVTALNAKGKFDHIIIDTGASKYSLPITTSAFPSDSSNKEAYKQAKESYLNDVSDNPFAIEQVMHDAAATFMSKVFEKYYPYDNGMFVGTAGTLASWSSTESLDADLYDDLMREMPLYWMSQEKGSLFDRKHEITLEDGTIITQEEYYLKHFPAIFMKNHKAFNYMPIFIGVDAAGNDYLILHQNVRVYKEYTEDFRAAWTDLATSDKEEARILARDLFVYSLYRYGYNPSSNSLIAHASPAVKNLVTFDGYNKETGASVLTYSEFLSSLIPSTASRGGNISDAVKQFIRNHSDNYKLVKKVKQLSSDKAQEKEYQEEAPEIVNVFPKTELAKTLTIYRGEEKILRPAFMYNNSFYELAEEDASGATYIKVDISNSTGDRTAYYATSAESTKTVTKEDMDAVHRELQETLGIDLQATPKEISVDDYRNSDTKHLNDKGQLQPKCDA